MDPETQPTASSAFAHVSSAALAIPQKGFLEGLPIRGVALGLPEGELLEIMLGKLLGLRYFKLELGKLLGCTEGNTLGLDDGKLLGDPECDQLVFELGVLL